ncbi:MAG TPA: S9 family peptidase [Steroidobacteraceae bacterium]|jgi:dipeptidyl aminopeptidase/acylaminoacyl peptidase
MKNATTTTFAVLLFIASIGASAEPATDSQPSVAAAAEKARQLIDAADFGALPFMIRPDLSPDARHVVTEAYLKGSKTLAIIQLTPKTVVTHTFNIPAKWDLRWYRWAGNDRVLVSVGVSDLLYGDEVYVSRLAMYDLKTGKVSFIGKRGEGFDGDTVIHVDPEGHWLLLNIQRTVFDYPTVWRVDLDTLDMKKVVGEYAHVWNWFADASGAVRAGLGIDGNHWYLLYRKSADAKFEKVLRHKVTQEEEDGTIERFIPIGGSDQGYVVSNARTGRYGLYRYDFASDALGEPIFEHPQVDIDDYRQADDGEITAVYYTDDRSRVQWLVPRMKELQATIDKALPDRINRVTSMSRDGLKMLVWTGSASDPGAYYYFDSTAGVMNLLARPYEKMKDKKLASVESVTYAARDGLQIPAYVTMPYGVDAKNLPLIIMPHGGPYIRDDWEYDTWAQFLANRGYLVLQPNFRGSTGYGKDFVAKGDGQWGRAMQDDLDDGVKWLVQQGKVDPKRVCIMGASYGGYAALWAAARNPDIYRCAISLAGLSDLQEQLRYDRDSFVASRYFQQWRQKMRGDKDFDLKTVSPLYAVDRITIPLLIAHGTEDQRVPLAQSRKLHEALLKANKPHSYVVYEGEGHGFDKPENATAFLERVDEFLRANNPAD